MVNDLEKIITEFEGIDIIFLMKHNLTLKVKKWWRM